MNSKLLKVFSCAMLGLSFVTCGVTNVSARSVGHGSYVHHGDYDGVFVSDANSFATAVSSAKNGDKIILEDDIYLDRNVEIKKSVIIDLNGNKIEMKNGAVIKVGAKLFDHNESYNVDHPGYYTTEKKVSYVKNPDMAVYDAYGVFLYYEKVPDTEVVTYEDVWHPGWTETKTRTVYRYLDDLDIMIENGKIKGACGSNGADGIENTFNDCDGERGQNGHEAISIISGTVRVRDASVVGGDGGNGGDGKYQAILHVPFFTGNGGNGGRGGNAGYAVVLERSGAHIVMESHATLKGGTPGNGGKKGPANTNHWIGKGKDGKEGKSGKVVKAILKNY